MTAPDDSAHMHLAEDAGLRPPVRLARPGDQTAPVIFASPHSGRDYPSHFVAQSRLDVLALRRSEDAFVDEVFAQAPSLGAPLLSAQFPRAYVDVNREAFELDPDMFSDPLPDYVNTSSPRIAAGLGTIARVVSDGEPIYRGPLTFADARQRIETRYRPYHRALARLIDDTKDRFGACLLIDCHSMPSGFTNGNGIGRPRNVSRFVPGRAARNNDVDVVLGDCFGTACAAIVTGTAERALRADGFSVVRNKPYAGGFTTRHYGRPRDGVHVLQVEINRGLYMDEARVKRAEGFGPLVERLAGLMRALAAIDPAELRAA